MYVEICLVCFVGANGKTASAILIPQFPVKMLFVLYYYYNVHKLEINPSNPSIHPRGSWNVLKYQNHKLYSKSIRSDRFNLCEQVGTER